MKDENIGIIVQARTGSTRLHNKIVKPFYNGLTILDIILERVKSNRYGALVVLATSTNPSDTALEKVAKHHNIPFFKGDEQNVLKRFVDAADYFGFSTIMRVCSDNPFLHLNSIDELIGEYTRNPADYISFMNGEMVPVIRTHLGLFTEIISVAALKKTQQLTSEALFCEHVTNYIYTHPENFKVKLLPLPSFLKNRNDIRLTIDTLEDFEILSELYSAFIADASNFDIKSLVDFIDNNLALLEGMKNSIVKNSK
ncbi:cytidylyltransferase domain-containing protein [Rufibacter latericius]|uniref:cytidylyltransferase domain-containing protein n=1 Tax=Rufibacter latericius TaxID=2487040 RepID=UPI001402AB49|nr:aminotransferase [Rufibacter latericius]